MKKLISVFMFLMLIFSSVSCFAEEFTVHSGVKFGMSIDEVAACEKEAGFGSYTKIDKYVGQFCRNRQEHSAIIEYSGKFAGQDGAMLHYHFSSTDGMEAAVYYFAGQASDVKDALMTKYGNFDPEYTVIAATKLNTEAYSYYLKGLEYDELLEKTTTKIYDEASWRVDQEDGTSIVISYVEYTTTGSKLTTVSYQLYMSEELDQYRTELVNTYNESQQQLIDDL